MHVFTKKQCTFVDIFIKINFTFGLIHVVILCKFAQRGNQGAHYIDISKCLLKEVSPEEL